MNTPLNLGLIGCGRAAEMIYLPALAHLPTEARLVAVADPLQERRSLITDQVPGCRSFALAEELLDKADLDAVIITTPPATHLPMAELALRAGIPALVEKPLAPSLEGIEAVETLAAASNAGVMVGFNRRYWQPVRQLQQIFQRNPQPDSITAQLILTSDAQTWSAISGVPDPLDDLGSHQLDLLRYVFGRDIQAISARRTDTWTIQMRVSLAGNIMAECLVAQSDVSQESVRVQCNDQQYQIRLGSERVQPASGPVRSSLDLFEAFNRRFRNRQSSLRSSYEQQLIKFFNYIRTGQTPQPDIADGVAVIQAVEAARESAADDGKEVLI